LIAVHGGGGVDVSFLSAPIYLTVAESAATFTRRRRLRLTPRNHSLQMPTDAFVATPCIPYEMNILISILLRPTGVDIAPYK